MFEINQINKSKSWLQDWRTKINLEKSRHDNITLDRKSCTPVDLNNTPVTRDNKVRYF